MSRRSEVAGHVPALGFAALNRFYDTAITLSMREPAWRPLIADLAAAESPRCVVDVGCGTGTLALAMAERLVGGVVTGVDLDPSILDIARSKEGAERIGWQVGSATALPLADASVDVVTCTLVLHHLPLEVKAEALREMRRVLRTGGLLVVGDWGKPHDPLMRAAFVPVQLLDGFGTTQGNVQGRVPELIERAGFDAPEREHRLRTVFGTFEVLTAR
jgi:ubiquinone/menaquinone biosynthesis C-methylase UbiE